MRDGAEAVFNGETEKPLPQEVVSEEPADDPFLDGVTIDEAAEMAGVSRSTMERGKQAVETGVDDAVMAGEAGKREVDEAAREQRGEEPPAKAGAARPDQAGGRRRRQGSRRASPEGASGEV